MDYLKLLDWAFGLLKKSGNLFVAPDDYKDFFLKSNCMFVICSLDGVLTNTNECFARSMGYTRKELIGQRYMSFLHPDDQIISAERLRNMQVGMHLSDSVSRWRHRNGHYIALGWTSVRNGKLYAVARFYYDLILQHEILCFTAFGFIGLH